MSCCNSYPACESSLPYACEPLEVTSQGKRVVVEDLSGCQKTIVEPDVPSLLRYDLTTQKIEWVDQTDISGLPIGTGLLVSEVSGSPFWLAGTTGQFLKVGAGGVFEFAPLTSWVSINSNTTIVAGQYILADTSSAPITLFLPATPSVSDSVVIADHSGTWDTNNLTVNRNSQTIEGLSENLICNISGKMFTLIFNGITWKLFTV
jgi:hypothetical protein